ncbi:DUF924 domain-containing protein [Sphingomonas donggukensis]|uniref:DUF924 domain-containing protein n=1 Tax=Sphingomonas donggukensis TaxID=2949093 RepID=A0ABY4U1R8_9SPHN|nr:DUF924 family protein [Sphingomonas donggukensis]URW76731.1 DUF924 domain-containing protein [Sphingomonas donggukensis]
MGGHLGSGTGEVHAAARAVLDFWFDEVGSDNHFAKDDALDRIIAERFGGWRDDVLASDALGWRSEPDTLLAAIILLDQFSRNIHRGSAEAFAADPLAESLAREGIERGWDRTLPPERAVFLLMPLMHAEHADAQLLSVAKFEALGIETNAEFARDHAAVIVRFGRFPSRNAALGRASTPAERGYLSQPGAGW